MKKVKLDKKDLKALASVLKTWKRRLKIFEKGNIIIKDNYGDWRWKKGNRPIFFYDTTCALCSLDAKRSEGKSLSEAKECCTCVYYRSFGYDCTDTHRGHLAKMYERPTEKKYRKIVEFLEKMISWGDK